MASTSAKEASIHPPSRRHRAAGIYGTVVTAAVLASAGTQLRTLALALAVLVTLTVYWVAEGYAEFGERAYEGTVPSWSQTRASMAAKWPLVSASFVPLAALILTRGLGSSATTAALVALLVTVALLLGYGWSAGRAAHLHGLRLLGMTLAAGALGGVMIGLKVLIGHLH
jgi:predicted histidine transporter YuiF (NhaC family)